MNIDFAQMQTMLAEAKHKYEDLRQRMAAVVVEATAGAGMVTVRMNGEKQLLDIRLDPDVVRNDPDMLPDLIRAAVNDASRRIEERMKSELGSVAGMPLGGLF